MATEQQPYPPPDALDRAVLVRNISPGTTIESIEDFFSFCGAIQSQRMRSIQAMGSGQRSQEAVIVFVDAGARADALVLDNSFIEDQVVSITPVPADYNFNALPDTPPQPRQPFVKRFSTLGELFSGVGSAVSMEVGRAGRAMDSATESGVLKSAKEQMARASVRTRGFANEMDQKYHFRDNLTTAAQNGRQKATQVASVVAERTVTVAKQVDDSLRISEKTGRFTERARENPTVNSGIRNIRGGLQRLLSQTRPRGGNAGSVNNDDSAYPETQQTRHQASTTRQYEQQDY